MAKQLALQGKVWITMDGENLGGQDRVALLASIAEHGSITQAAKAIKMSYKGAWDAIAAMNELAGEPLVERLAGGKGGGGSRLTPRGAQLVASFRQVELEHRLFVEQLGRESQVPASVCSQFACTVGSIRRGALIDELVLDMPGGSRLVAVVAHDTVDRLALCEGAPVLALVKASSVILATGVGGARLSARNQLPGTVSQVHTGAVNSDITLALPGGTTLAATVTRESEQELGLAPGVEALALFKASSVIVGVPG